MSVVKGVAGLSWFGPTPDLDAENFDAMFASNVRSAYLLVAALAPKMAARGKAASSTSREWPRRVGLAGGAAYSATKASLAAMTRS
jgi:NAD(P)-dependent dehydrogenase (short-subunit alcohol dehydrogenase family)